MLIDVSLGWRWFVLIGNILSGDSRYRGNVEINVKDRSHICHISGTEWGGTFRFDSCIVSPDSALSSIQLVTRAQFVWQMLSQQLFISLPDHRYGHWASLCQFAHWFCATIWKNMFGNFKQHFQRLARFVQTSHSFSSITCRSKSTTSRLAGQSCGLFCPPWFFSSAPPWQSPPSWGQVSRTRMTM